MQNDVVHPAARQLAFSQRGQQPTRNAPQGTPALTIGSLFRVLLRRPSLTRQDLLVVVVALAAATAARALLDPLLGNKAPHGFYVIATLYIAWSRGLWPALVVVVVGALLANFLFVPPRYALYDEGFDDHVNTALSMFLGISTAVLVESLRAVARENARLYRVAQEAAVRREEFIAMASHELRNPLAPIRNALEILREPDLSPAENAEAREMIERQLRHLIRLVDDLLDVSRLTRGAIGLRKEQVELASIVETAVEIAAPLVEAKQQNLSISLPDKPLYLYADPTRLTQALANLLNNAAKYTPDEGKIWLSAALEEDQVVIRVRDNGIGLAPESLTRIFEAFEQVDTSSHASHGGLGIGLALVRRLVQLHGGRVTASSPGRGRGSEFVVHLPRLANIRPPQEPPPAVEAPRATEPRQAAATPRRVLVVDDDRANARSLGMLLALRKHQVEVCHDGATAVEIARRFRPDVVLADLGMPGMSGLELARRLRAIPELDETQLVAVTGYGRPGDRHESQTAGFDWHLVKPVDSAELDQILQGTSEQPPAGCG